MMRSAWVRTLGWAAALVGCDAGGGGGVGAPCNDVSDCDDDLICDEHDGQASCQIPHDHGDDGEGDPPVEASSPNSSEQSAAQASELCVAYCGCLADTCATVEGYPHADEQACLTACEALSDDALGCFGRFCEQAKISTPELAGHQCEHAWGGLGTEEC